MCLPLFVTEKLPALGTTGDLLLTDPSLYIIGDRMAVMIDVSDPGPGFRTNQSWFNVWLRQDAMPLTSGIITLQDTQTQVSQVVVLQ
jgi:HK97 family phage major capsid protein